LFTKELNYSELPRKNKLSIVEGLNEDFHKKIQHSRNKILNKLQSDSITNIKISEYLKKLKVLKKSSKTDIRKLLFDEINLNDEEEEKINS
jgi:hypothetical protein